MKKLLIVCLLVLTVTGLMCLVSCGGGGSTQATTAGSSVETTPVKPTETTPKTTTTTTTTAPTTTSQKPADTEEPFVEAEHISMTADGVTVTSLDEKLVMKLGKDASGNIVYTLSTADGTEIIGESKMGIAATNFDGFAGSTFTAAEAKRLNVTYSYIGNFSEMTDNCVAATVTLKSGSYQYAVEIKLYDNGVAFRYNLPKTSQSRSVKGEETSFRVNDILKVWYGQSSNCYESVISSAGYSSINTNNKLTGPLTIELTGNKGYVALMEGFVTDKYIGTNFVSTGSDNTFKISGSWTTGQDFDQFSASGDIVTGWRIINYSQDLGEISLNNNIYHTALGMDGDVTAYEDLDWITPGKSVWSWINDRGVPFEPQIEYTLNAAKLGFTYNIIDEGYTVWEDYEDKLLELGLLGDDVGVKQILWAAVANGHRGYQINSAVQAKVIMKKLADLHMSGIKLDFFSTETNQITQSIQRATLEQGIANKIIVNFHGVHKPISFAVQYPNELSREGIRGLENISRSDIGNQAKFFTAQYYTRLLSGHADFTPDVNTSMQIASLVVLDSPLMVIATAPADILANPALEMIRAIPTAWDRTVFLDGTIGSYVSVAKEKDGVWYIGGITSTIQRDVKVDLSKILGDGEYLLTYWKDKSITAKEKFVQKVTKDSVINLGNLNAGCGYVMQITKLAISQYGGEITAPIQIETASADAVVKYTIDGSDPMTSETAIVANGSITLNESCLLRVAITDGDGKGTELSYQFNKVEYNGIEYTVDYHDNETVLTLNGTLEGVKIYYTTDGSDPTASSTLYTGPITVSEKTAIKAVAISENGKSSAVKSITLLVKKAITAITPDVYIGADYKQAVAGWNNKIGINVSMNDTPLSLGGISASTGTQFSHGISTNAIGYFVYDIPENAKEFVGVVGIDDSTYNNTSSGYKASIICKITVDGKVLYTSGTLGQGDYEQIRITLPEGAKEIRIDFGDAGNGITCDNATLAEAGFLLNK